jgi:hypothetical protein
MTTKTINLYTFAELSDKAKESARDWWRECEAQDFGGHGELNEPIETAARILGINLRTHDVKLLGGGTRTEPNVWWTLHVQGAGASYDASYSYAKGSTKAIRAEFGTDEKLWAIADGLAAIQKRYGYRLSAAIKSDTRGHFLEIDFDTVQPRDAKNNDLDSLRELFRDFGHWIYERIDAEYTFRMTDENVDEAMDANEYTFTEAGKRED